MSDYEVKFAEQRTEMMTFRLTPTQRRYLAELAQRLGVGEADFIRQALDHFITHHLPALGGTIESGRTGARVAASSATPSSDKAKVKASSKSSPAKSTKRKQ